jgi:hypothetical protein
MIFDAPTRTRLFYGLVLAAATFVLTAGQARWGAVLKEAGIKPE